MVSALGGWLHSVHSAVECSRCMSALSAECFKISLFHHALESARSTVCGVGMGIYIGMALISKYGGDIWNILSDP